jgi:hypothetical protein
LKGLTATADGFSEQHYSTALPCPLAGTIKMVLASVASHDQVGARVYARAYPRPWQLPIVQVCGADAEMSKQQYN